jgi:hypothetical protein
LLTDKSCEAKKDLALSPHFFNYLTGHVQKPAAEQLGKKIRQIKKFTFLQCIAQEIKTLLWNKVLTSHTGRLRSKKGHPFINFCGKAKILY